MSACPVEIWAHIFAFACTDDGATGRALTLVSRWVNEVSAPYAVQSLEAPTAHLLAPLAAMLERRPPARRRVLYLSLADRIVHDFCWGGRVVQRLAGMDLDAHDGRSLEDAFAVAHAITRILRAAAPTLRVLHMDVSNTAGFPRALVPVRLPVLTELALGGLRAPFAVAGEPACPLPSLRCLRVFNWGYKDGGNNIAVLEDLPWVAPALEHLLVSGYGAFDSRDIALVLANTICSPDAGRAAQFAKLRVMFTPIPRPPQVDWLAGQTDTEALDAVREMAKSVTGGRFIIGV